MSLFDHFAVKVCDAAEAQLADEDPETARELLDVIQVILDDLAPDTEDPADPLYQSNPQVLARELIRYAREIK